MEDKRPQEDFFGAASIGKILLRIAPPVMLAQLIQALYNIVDSFFVGRYSPDALTALTVIYPMQLIIVALAVGTGVGVNTYMARAYALGEGKRADDAAGTGMVLGVSTWAVFALLSTLIMPRFVRSSATAPLAIDYAVTYGRIVCIGSIGVFLESNWTKVHQSIGNMKLPMLAQVAGALINIVLDPVLIFGLGPVPAMGVAGAAWATVCGQCVAAVITGVRGVRRPPNLRKIPQIAHRIYHYGYPSIIMQLLFTVYILALNVILSGFSDAAVTVLGLYYKAQSFFFIPLIGLQTCIVPVLSYNYARANFMRCEKIVRESFIIALSFMVVGIVCFVGFPETLLSLFSAGDEVVQIGKSAFPIIGASFLSAVFSLMLPVFFQAIGDGRTSLLLSLTRQIFCLIPLFWLLSKPGLGYTWIAFPISETITGGVGLYLYTKHMRLLNIGGAKNHQWTGGIRA